MNINYTTSTEGNDDAFRKTLYVGNLDPNVSEAFILDLFSVIGPCKGCKMIQSPSGTFCFVEYMEHSTALAAHSAMNKRKVYGKEIVVNWATCIAAKKDTSNHHHIFVGDLAPETDSEDLKNYFLKIGEVSDARVMKDITTNKSKGYGFVSFVKYQDALDIVEKKRIIPDVLHGRQVRCNWATRKGTQTTVQKLDYNTVVSQSSPTNTTVYLGGCMSGLTDQLMRETFSGFGNIQEIRVFPDKGFAFIRLDSHNDAAMAITSKHGSSLEGYTIKCSWGKEGAVNLAGGTVGGVGSGFTNGMSTGMDMNNWSPGTDVWSQQGQQQQQFNNQWTAWRNPNQQQQQQQQNSWNAWGAPNQMNNTNGWMNNWGTWGSNNSTWGWSGQGQAQAGGDGGWGTNNMRPNGDQAQMWNTWNSQQAGMGGTQQTNADTSNKIACSLGSGDPQQQQQQQQQQQRPPSNGFTL